MGYIGAEPATSFETVRKDRFTSQTGTTVTLSHTVSSINDIVVWVNSVKQDYTNYSVSGTTLTLGGSLVSADIVEVAYIGRTFQTVAPDTNMVTNAMMADDSIDSAEIVDGSVDTAHIGALQVTTAKIAADAIDGTKIADDAINSEHYTDGSIDLAHMSSESVDEDNLHISNAGTNGQFLSKQSGNTGGLTWADAGGDLSFGGDTFGANKVIGANDAYSLSLETSGNTALTIDANGQITKPLQPAFVCTPSANSSAIGADTLYSIVSNTEILDRNGDWDGSTTFTAPKTGMYLLGGVVVVGNYDHDSNGAVIQINTSNRIWMVFGRNGNMYDNDGTFHIGFSVAADMDANDTAIFQLHNNQGTQQPLVYQEHTFLSGWLLG